MNSTIKIPSFQEAQSRKKSGENPQNYKTGQLWYNNAGTLFIIGRRTDMAFDVTNGVLIFLKYLCRDQDMIFCIELISC